MKIRKKISNPRKPSKKRPVKKRGKKKQTGRAAALRPEIDERSLLLALINSMPDHIYAKNLEHRFVLCNQAVADNIGVSSPDQVIGRTDADFFPPDLVEQYMKDERLIFTTGQPLYNREEAVTDPQGAVNYALTNKVPLRNSRGKVIGLFGINRNITELKKLREKEQAFIEAVKRELALARNIQQGFLPESLPVMEGWDLASNFTPAQEVSGDFYEAMQLDDSTLVIAVGDVSGKNISAALFMSHVITLLKAFAERLYAESKSPVEAVALINKYLCYYHPAGDMGIRFVTLFLGVIDTKTGSMEYVNAGHLPPFIVTSRGGVLRPAPTGPAIGISTAPVFSRKSLHIDHDDLLFLFTDGVTEARNAGDDFFTDARLAGIVQAHGADPHRLIAAVNDAIAHYSAGCEQSDDITMLALKRR